MHNFINKTIISILFICLNGCALISNSTKVYNTKYNDKSISVSKVQLKDELRDEITLYSLSLLNIQYQWGSQKPDFGLDCSGLVSYVYANAVNIKLPHKASLQAMYGKEIDHTELKPGDLLFFNTTGKDYSHVGIYVGDNKFVHAPKKGDFVKISKFEKYYRQKFQKAVTFFG